MCKCCQLSIPMLPIGNWELGLATMATFHSVSCSLRSRRFRVARRGFSCPPSGRARRVADKRRAADGLPSKPVRRDGRQSPQGDRPRRRLSWPRASAQCGRDVRSPRFLTAAALAKAVAAVSLAALVKSSVVKDQNPEGLGRAARSNILVSQCGNMSPHLQGAKTRFTPICHDGGGAFCSISPNVCRPQKNL